MNTFLKINGFLLKFLTMGILSLKQETTKKSLLESQGDKNIHSEVQDLFVFAKKTQLYPVGSELYNDEYNLNLAKLLEIVDCTLDIEEFLNENIQQQFYCTFLKLICLRLKHYDCKDDDQIMHKIETDIIPEIILMLLNHSRGHFFRTYKTVDVCLSRFITKDKTISFVIQYYKNGF